MFMGYFYLVLDSKKYFYKGYENNYNNNTLHFK